MVEVQDRIAVQVLNSGRGEIPSTFRFLIRHKVNSNLSIMQDSIKDAPSRGGARPGSGRKRGENSRNIRASFNLSPKAAAALQAAADRDGCSRNDLINRLLEAL